MSGGEFLLTVLADAGLDPAARATTRAVGDRMPEHALRQVAAMLADELADDELVGREHRASAYCRSRPGR